MWSINYQVGNATQAVITCIYVAGIVLNQLISLYINQRSSNFYNSIKTGGLDVYN